METTRIMETLNYYQNMEDRNLHIQPLSDFLRVMIAMLRYPDRSIVLPCHTHFDMSLKEQVIRAVSCSFNREDTSNRMEEFRRQLFGRYLQLVQDIIDRLETFPGDIEDKAGYFNQVEALLSDYFQPVPFTADDKHVCMLDPIKLNSKGVITHCGCSYDPVVSDILKFTVQYIKVDPYYNVLFNRVHVMDVYNPDKDIKYLRDSVLDVYSYIA